MEYSEEISRLGRFGIEDIVRISGQYSEPTKRKDLWWRRNTAARRPYDCHCAALTAYVEEWKSDIIGAFHYLPFIELVDSPLAIVDYGSVQGISTVVFIHYLREMELLDNLQAIYVKGPSEDAIGRAALHVSGASPDNVRLITSGTDRVEEGIVIHFLGNVFELVVFDYSSLAIGPGVSHYFLSVGHMDGDAGKMDSYCRSFCDWVIGQGVKPLYSDGLRVDSDDLVRFAFYCLTRGFSLSVNAGAREVKAFLCIGPVQFQCAMLPDVLLSNLDEAEQIGYSFAVYKESSIQLIREECKDAVAAIVDGIISRGCPTLCSPLVEKYLARYTGISRLTDDSEMISYKLKNSERLLRYETRLERLTISIGRLQKVMAQLLMSGSVEAGCQEWNILVKEGDYPCAALAVKDFSAIYDAVAEAIGCGNRFPRVNLTIISQNKMDSRLHLNRKVVKSAAELTRSAIKWDIIIDADFDSDIALDVALMQLPVNNDCRCLIRNVKPDNAFAGQLSAYSRIRIGPIGPISTVYSLLTRRRIMPDALQELVRGVLAGDSVGFRGPTGWESTVTAMFASVFRSSTALIVVRDSERADEIMEFLLSVGWSSAVMLGSVADSPDFFSKLRDIRTAQVKLAVVTAEVTHDYYFRRLIRNMRSEGNALAAVVIENADSISEWSVDFNPDYQGLHSLLGFVGSSPVVTFAGECDSLIEADIAASVPNRQSVMHTGKTSSDYSLAADLAAGYGRGPLHRRPLDVRAEKRCLNVLLSHQPMVCFYGDDRLYKSEDYIETRGFLDEYLGAAPGAQLVALVPGEPSALPALKRALYRLECIGVVDYWTIMSAEATATEASPSFILRIVMTRKKQGACYTALWHYLSRYFTDAENMAEQASLWRGDNEIHRTVGYLLGALAGLTSEIIPNP